MNLKLQNEAAAVILKTDAKTHVNKTNDKKQNAKGNFTFCY